MKNAKLFLCLVSAIALMGCNNDSKKLTEVAKSDAATTQENQSPTDLSSQFQKESNSASQEEIIASLQGEQMVFACIDQVISITENKVRFFINKTREIGKPFLIVNNDIKNLHRNDSGSRISWVTVGNNYQLNLEDENLYFSTGAESPVRKIQCLDFREFFQIPITYKPNAEN